MDASGVLDILIKVHNAEGVNLGAASTRESRNAFFARVIGVVYHGHPVYNATPDRRWHLKNGGPGRPQSDDVAVIMPERVGMDFITSAGADGYRLQVGEAFAIPPEQEVWAPPVPSGGGGVVQPLPSLWSAAHSAELAKLGAPNGSIDAAFTLRVAEHFAAVFPADGWGQKKASGDRPVSGDVVARRDGARLLGYKVVPLPTGAPAQMDITGQVFVAVAPVNYAPATGGGEGGGTGGGSEGGPVIPPTVFDAIVGGLASLNQGVSEAVSLAREARDAAQAAEKAALDTQALAEKLKGQKLKVKGLPSWFGNPTIELPGADQ